MSCFFLSSSGFTSGWQGNYFCEGVHCSDTYRVPNSFNPQIPGDMGPTHSPLYGYGAVSKASRALYTAPLGTTYMYACMRGFYRQYAGVMLACLGDSQWYAYDRFLIEARTAAPKTLGNLIALPESGTQVDPGSGRAIRLRNSTQALEPSYDFPWPSCLLPRGVVTSPPAVRAYQPRPGESPPTPCTYL